MTSSALSWSGTIAGLTEFAARAAVVIDSRSCRSAPSCFERGVDSGKKIHGINIYLGVQKYGITLAVDVSPANMHDTKGNESPLRQLAG
jgi:hypothetical protein